MLCCETGGTSAQDVEDLAVFVSQLDALGLPARVHVLSVPEGLNRNVQFDLAPYLFDGALAAGDRVVVVGAQRLTDQTLLRLRRIAGSAGPECLAFGTFRTRQAMLGAKAKLSYVLGCEPRIVDVTEDAPEEVDENRTCPVFGVARRTGPERLPHVLLVEPDLADRAQAAALGALSLSRQFRSSVLTDGKSKHDWIASHGREIDFYHYGETLPAALAARVDVLVSFVPLQKNYRLQSLVANLVASGGALVDSTPAHAIARAGDAFVRGPLDLGGLVPFLSAEILPNLSGIGAHVRASRAAASLGPDRVLAAITPEPARPRTVSRQGPARVVFMPTNGVGLGHAKRCALVAAEMDRARVEPVFAAFPSCTRLLKSRGFDVMPLVARSPDHAQSHENDLANYLRLRALTATAETLVFDGGYVFDSVYRSILEHGLKGVWIRRGLWQAAQDNSVALDREKAFDRVIVPREAFGDLNAVYSQGDHVRSVGPIVQRATLAPEERAAMRADLAARFGIDFERLVLTQLGAGVAADRSAQIQALCGAMARRRDLLHLIVVWPTASLQPAWLGWPNSRVVRTQHAGTLALAADLCVTAAGYNSFHEVLYNRIPALFIPQTGAFMDDQAARARAARERGLAAMVEPHELMRLERELGGFLDGERGRAIRERIAGTELPEPGNAEAARLIEEVGHGIAMEFNPVADRPAGRR